MENLHIWDVNIDKIFEIADIKILINWIKTDVNSVSRDISTRYIKYVDIKESLTLSNEPSYISLCTELEEQYITYWRYCKKREIKRTDELRRSMDFVFKVSLMEQFCVHDVGHNDISVLPITLAPVVSFLAIHQYGDCAERALKQINTKIFSKPARISLAPQMVELTLKLFNGLCHSYAKFYGNRYDRDIQSEWDAAFLVYSGFRELYQVKLKRTKRIDVDELPNLLCFQQIHNCLLNNRVSLAHNWLTRCNGSLDDFTLTENDGTQLKTYYFFRNMLMENFRKCQKPWLTQFQEFLQYPYSHGAIQDFLLNCLGDIQMTAQREKGGQRKLREAEVQMETLCPNIKDSTVRMCVALEYTMRCILAERCQERLYHWLSEYFDYQLLATELTE